MGKKIYVSFFIVLSFVLSTFNQTSAQLCTPTAPQTFTNSTPVTIPTGPAVVSSTLVVSGAPTYLYDVNVTTFITHTFAADLDITIMSPSGTVVTLTTDNGGGFDNVFNGTVWDDDANPGGQVPHTSNNGLVTDHVYTNLTLASPLVPEEALGAFVGEDPNGTWTITISDDAGGDGGTLSSWSLAIAGLNAAPTTAMTSATNSTPVAIPSGPAVVTSTINIAGAGTQILDVNVLTNITHTWSNDLDITITSPSGTVVTLTTDNGGSLDNVYNGTVWDDDANPGGQVPYTTNNGLATDHSYVNLVLASPLVPEEALAAFIGEDPNGTWTLTISDDTGGDGGNLSSWTLNITTSTCAPPTAPCAGLPVTFTNNTPVAITDNTTVTSSITVSGAPTYLYDLNLTTFITHTFAGDLDITLTSPSGTVVTITTDNGGGNDDVFNGTVWDDSGGSTNPPGPVTDNVFTNLVVETPLVPEEALAAFIGEDPNGLWTISISDDASADEGILNSWSLNILGLSTVPITSTTTTSNNTPVPIPDPGTTTSTITVIGAGSQILDVNMLFNILHDFPTDLDITLTSPAGTVVTISTDNGGGATNAFNGTLWDDYAGATNPPGAVTDNTYTANVVETPLVPEEAMGAFIGEDPNGVWTLTITDDFSADAGTLTFWSLDIVTSLCAPSCTLTCPANIVVSNDPGQCGAVVNYPAPTTSGACGTVTSSPPSGSFFPVGTTTVTAQTSSGGGFCSFTITVNDTEPPTIICPANIVTGNTPGQCGATVNYTVAASDNCPGVTVVSTPASGTFFPVGTTTVTSTATDASGNVAFCTFTVTVSDTEAPTITCPANITVNNTPGQCAAVVNYNLPTATDNCALPGSISLTQNTNNTTITPLTGIACPTGDNHFWRAYTLALSGPLTITAVRFGVEVNATAQVATVNIYTSAGPFPASPRTLVGSQTVNITTASGVFYTANFATPPTVPANAIVAIEVSVPTGGMWPGANTLGESAPAYISSATCGVANPVTLASLGFTSHIIIDLMGNVAGPSVFSLVSGLPSGSSFPVGTTTNVWRATDASGNTATCSFTVTVVDNQPPAISCPANITSSTPIGSCTAIVNYSVTATDNCPGVTTALVSGPASGSAFPLGTTTVVWRATDAAGNTSTCSFTVTVNDAQIPVISSQPQNTSVCEGSTATFSVTAAPLGGPNNLTYQWQVFNGTTFVDIPGATSSTLTVPNVTMAMAGTTYRVRVIGLCTTITSGMATLTVKPLPAISLSLSRDPALTPGQLLNITASVSLPGGTIQWYRNGVPMPIGSVFSLTNLTVDDAGTYHAVYTAPNGCSVTSANVVVSKASSSDVFVFPNPNNGQFQVRVFETNTQITITVYNSAGAMVYQRSESTGTTPYTGINVNLSAMAAGQYIVEVRDSSGDKLGVKQIIVWR